MSGLIVQGKSMNCLLMAHQNIAKVEGGILTVDRKFHVGMLSYANGISAPIVTIHPESDTQPVMDPVQVAVKDLPYQIMTVKVDRGGNPLPSERPRLLQIIAGSKLVYGDGLSAPAIARRIGIPYIPILEYDLQTRTKVATANVKNPIRRAVRVVRTALNYRKHLGSLRHAHSLHCNGYPIYDATRPYNKNSLLYLDSRMSKNLIISKLELETRLARVKRPVRLLYSGRYEQMKGVLDAVLAAEISLRLGFDIEMHCFGQGTLKADIEKVARRSGGRIVIHDAVPYTDLVNIARGFDVFVCCHVQNDPSCTYLESFGAGLPIVGYANRMWQRLCQESGAGLVSQMGSPSKVAQNIGRLNADPVLLAKLSWNALTFANAHCYENEWAKRIDAINAAIAQ